MKKISKYFFIVLISLTVLLFGFGHKNVRQPNTYYQVYLDNELIGLIESKEELQDYINKQAETIRKNIKEYSLKLDAIDTFKRYEASINVENYTVVDKVNYLIANKSIFNLSDIDLDNLNFYKKEKLYNLSSPG